ncbi:MAG TPA: hypothetical protein IGS52_25885 [Oscillatoriaceae cyanobacterium M33_DOE_052]|uniref:Uncharacterized protein n=1 Tax=Planktothricoides sp. SpSt-374 TaxID=2282167 RepID=A0A7C3ZMY0_9CYAN|nr:hypothetical protein [Oscillatoriaceae cyanobacterium M33_DOE_052]
MLVILMEEQMLTPAQVCQNCLLADRSGQPRWRDGHLTCGHAISTERIHQPDQYECQMGFRIAHVK